ncbi:MAG: phage/plasmid primase, P4 family, partial [Anaerolineae bacterium]
VLTGGGGDHFYFRHPGKPVKSGPIAPGLDLKGDGGYVIAPPSIHPSGWPYDFEVQGHPDDVPLAEMPQWLLALVAEKAGNGHRQGEPLADTIPAGQRNRTLASLAGTLRRRNMSQVAAEAALLAENQARCRPPLPEAEVLAIVASVYRYAPGEPAPLPQEAESMQKDYGHADRLSRHFLGRFRWATHLGSWMEWTGAVWRPVAEERVAKMASDTLRGEYAALLATAARQDIPHLAGLLRDACTYARITGALAFLKGWDNILTGAYEWDTDPWLLNVANGLLDLHTGELRPHSPGDLCTKLAPVTYDPQAKGEHWQQHLDRFLPNPNVQRQVQRDLGLALVGATLEEALPLWFGSGANGKTTTARALQTVLGDYAKRAAPNLLVQSRNERHPTEIADLCGARLVFSVEVDEGKRLAEALVKDLTGGDRKKARLMRQDFFEFEQSFSIVLIVNHKPVITGCDDGIWRRVRLIPWQYRIPEAERRPQEEVVAELVADGSAILNWLLAGLRDWQGNRHWLAPAVQAATDAYRAEQDVLAGFLAECCQLGPRYTAPVGELYEAYTAWCAGAGEEALGKARFGDSLKRRGLGQKRVGNERTRRWVGLRLRPNGG